MEHCDYYMLEMLAYYFAGFVLGAGSAFLGFRSYYKDLYRVKR